MVAQLSAVNPAGIRERSVSSSLEDALELLEDEREDDDEDDDEDPAGSAAAGLSPPPLPPERTITSTTTPTTTSAPTPSRIGSRARFPPRPDDGGPYPPPGAGS